MLSFRFIEEKLCRREQEAAALIAERNVLAAKVTQLEEQVQNLDAPLQQKEKHMQVDPQLDCYCVLQYPQHTPLHIYL